MTDMILDTLAWPGGNPGAAREQFVNGAFEAQIGRRIDAIGKIAAHRAQRRLVANPESNRMNHVVEVRKIALAGTE